MSAWLAPLAVSILAHRTIAPTAAENESNSYPLVSIVVPARDEEANLPRLLSSLARLDYPRTETIVVDDGSMDRTGQIAREYGALVVDPGEPAPGWSGKTWACGQGAIHAKGKYLLFTDADTEHEPGSLKRVVARMEAGSLDLLSSPPFHRCPTAWEKCLGPFHLLVLSATALAQKPRPDRLFAIGQYLLFEKGYYDSIQGHASVRGTLAEDLAFAKACISGGGRYGIHSAPDLYSVRMYSSPAEFIAGWRRIVRWGLKRSTLKTSLETGFVVFALASLAFSIPTHFLSYLACAILLAVTQRRHGEFSVAGAMLFPISIATFSLVTLLSILDLAAKRDHRWKGRAYAHTRS